MLHIFWTDHQYSQDEEDIIITLVPTLAPRSGPQVPQCFSRHTPEQSRTSNKELFGMMGWNTAPDLRTDNNGDLLKKALEEDSVVVAHGQVLWVVQLPAGNLGEEYYSGNYTFKKINKNWDVHLSQPLVQTGKILGLKKIFIKRLFYFSKF